jgi:hypothetical protein
MPTARNFVIVGEEEQRAEAGRGGAETTAARAHHADGWK